MSNFRLPRALNTHLKSPTSTNTSAYSSQAGSENLLDKLSSANCQTALKNLSEEKDPIQLYEREPIAHSFQDIHGNYAKRRYKNVQSKVGRYIASIRAEERKRRAAKLVRCKSAPVNFSVTTAVQEDVNSEEQQHKGFSTNDLYKLHESTLDYADVEVMTSSTYSNSTHGAGSSSKGGASRHESSDDAVSGADFIDKQTYAQLVFEKEHLEALLEEKRTECMRHKRNVDFLRIELANCQDELKQSRANPIGSNLRYTTAFVGYSFAARPGCSLEKPTAVTQATQTDLVTTIDGTSKRISTNENILRLRTNSFSQKIEKANRRSYDYSEENSISKAKSRILQDASPPASPGASTKSCSPYSQFTYYERHYAPVSTKDISAESNNFDENAQSSNTTQKNMPTIPAAAAKRRRQLTTTFRQRLNRIFGRCTRCDDPNQSADAYGVTYHENNIEMIQSPTPLLTRSQENQHRNVN